MHRDDEAKVNRTWVTHSETSLRGRQEGWVTAFPLVAFGSHHRLGVLLVSVSNN